MLHCFLSMREYRRAAGENPFVGGEDGLGRGREFCDVVSKQPCQESIKTGSVTRWSCTGLCVIQYKARGTDTAAVVSVITYHCEIVVLHVLLS